MSFIRTTKRWVLDVEELEDEDVGTLEAYRIVGERYAKSDVYVRDRVTAARRVGFDVLDAIQGRRGLDNYTTLRRLGHKMKTKSERLEYIRLFQMKTDYTRRNGRRELDHARA